MRGASDRTLAIAVAASILAHALILLVVPELLDPSRKRLSASPIVARLVPLRPPPAPPPVVEPRIEPRVEPRVEYTPRPVRIPPAIRSAQPALATPPVVAVPALRAAPAPEAPGIAESAPPVSPPAVPTVPTAKPDPSAPPAAAVAGESSDPLTLGQYRIAIITAAKRYKKYPRIAMDNNWEGQAEIRMVIGADGSIASISIKTRSGFEALDQQALEMIRKAKPLAPIPAQLRGKGFTVDVPVVFSLKEESG